MNIISKTLTNKLKGLKIYNYCLDNYKINIR